MSQSPKPDSGSGQSTQLNINTPENEKANYQDGYAKGRNAEANHQDIRSMQEQISGGNNVVAGLLIGLLTVGMIVGVIAYTQWNKNPTPAPQPQINNSSEKNTTIERTVDHTKELVPVPQAPPVQPVQPVQPAQPAQPAQPVQPVQPVNP